MPCRCRERRKWAGVEHRGTLAGIAIWAVKKAQEKAQDMSLQQRLKNFEQRLGALEKRVNGQEQGLTQLVDAIEAADAGNDEGSEPVVSLDGEQFGAGERDQSQPL